jgi:CheY-like chemotaxis protein
MDGIQLLRKIKQANENAEVIMITGHGDIELAIQSMKFDAADFITKPINGDVLEIALKRVDEKIRLKAEVRNYTENLEKMVEEKSRKLVEAERLAAVGQTVAGLAHTIKNVTAGLTGGMYVLEAGVELEDKVYRSQGWEMLKRNIGRIERMVLDLLNYAKERHPAYQLCDPNLPAREVFDLMLSKAKITVLHLCATWQRIFRKHGLTLKVSTAAFWILSQMLLRPVRILTNPRKRGKSVFGPGNRQVGGLNTKL